MEIPVMSDFENKVAFITGAAHGQGRATALALAKEGADIAEKTAKILLNHCGTQAKSASKGHDRRLRRYLRPR